MPKLTKRKVIKAWAVVTERGEILGNETRLFISRKKDIVRGWSKWGCPVFQDKVAQIEIKILYPKK